MPLRLHITLLNDDDPDVDDVPGRSTTLRVETFSKTAINPEGLLRWFFVNREALEHMATALRPVPLEHPQYDQNTTKQVPPAA